jgi:hypothetical protein
MTERTKRTEMKRIWSDAKEQVMDSAAVEVHDTVMEVTTVTVQLGAAGDTVFRSIVTDRTRAKSRENRAVNQTKTEVRVDTVFVERRDSVSIRSPTGNRQSALQDILKWIFWIIVGLIVLTVIIKIKN